MENITAISLAGSVSEINFTIGFMVSGFKIWFVFTMIFWIAIGFAQSGSVAISCKQPFYVTLDGILQNQSPLADIGFNNIKPGVHNFEILIDEADSALIFNYDIKNQKEYTFFLIDNPTLESSRKPNWEKLTSDSLMAVFCISVLDIPLNQHLFDSTVRTDTYVDSAVKDSLQNIEAIETVIKKDTVSSEADATIKNQNNGVSDVKDKVPLKDEISYSFIDYRGSKGCNGPLTKEEFTSIHHSIQAKDFEDSRLKVAKHVVAGKCILVAQIKVVMKLFDFEDTKLEFAKFAYDYTYDLGNFFQVNDDFEFESSTDALIEYINSKSVHE